MRTLDSWQLRPKRENPNKADSPGSRLVYVIAEVASGLLGFRTGLQAAAGCAFPMVLCTSSAD